MRGAPNDFSMTTLRPLWPRVTLTALAMMSTPRNMRSRASHEKRTSLADIFKLLKPGSYKFGKNFSRLGDDAQDVALLHDQEILTIDLDLGARPFAEQNLVARFDIERGELAAFIAAARANSDDFAFLGLLLDRIGDDDPALGLFLTFESSDHNAVMQWAKAHVFEFPNAPLGASSLFAEGTLRSLRLI